MIFVLNSNPMSLNFSESKWFNMIYELGLIRDYILVGDLSTFLI